MLVLAIVVLCLAAIPGADPGLLLYPTKNTKSLVAGSYSPIPLLSVGLKPLQELKWSQWGMEAFSHAGMSIYHVFKYGST